MLLRDGPRPGGTPMPMNPFRSISPVREELAVMVPVDSEIGPIGVGLANDAIVSALLVYAVREGLLTKPQVQEILSIALRDLDPRKQTQAGHDAAEVIG